jgi:hypothetical protein
MLNKFINDEAGFIISAELMIIITLLFCAAVVGAAMIRDALVQEMGDVAEMIGSLDQSYTVGALSAPFGDGVHASCGGSGNGEANGFQDATDACDCEGVLLSQPNPEDLKQDPNVAGSDPI